MNDLTMDCVVPQPYNYKSMWSWYYDNFVKSTGQSCTTDNYLVEYLRNDWEQ